MTAVEFLEKEIFRNYHFLLQKLNCEPLKEAINQAKEMEKQQMKDAVLAQATKHEGLRKIFDKQFEKYYNEKFNLSQQDKP
jgi:hypothetical protein